jgi:hypothetical protein
MVAVSGGDGSIIYKTLLPFNDMLGPHTQRDL